MSDWDNPTDSISFGTLHPDGTLTNQRTVKRMDIARCPQFILMAEHYREDGSCRCDEGHYDEETGEWVEDGTCEDRGYVCCDLTPPPGEDEEDEGWYLRHLDAWRHATIWSDQ